VHLAGRTQASLDAVAEEIRASGGRAEAAVVDALDEAAVDAHANAVAGAAGSLDISLNVITHGDVQGTPLAEMALADFEQPVHNAVRTLFLTARAAARHMIRQRSGVVLLFGGYGDPLREHSLGGLQVAFQAQEALKRNLAAELGPHGIRVLTLQTGGIPESIRSDAALREQVEQMTAERTLVGRAATLEDVASVAAFAASDRAAAMTATKLNITAGAYVDPV